MILAFCSVMFVLPLAKVDPAAARFEREGVQIVASVAGARYTYEVTNRNTSPIVRFEIGQLHIFNPQTPEGWQAEEKANRFLAWTDDVSQGIQPGQSKSFLMSVSSAGAVLGTSPAEVVLADGRSVVIGQVWTSRLPPRSSTLLLSGVLAAIILLHTLWILRRRVTRAGDHRIT